MKILVIIFLFLGIIGNVYSNYKDKYILNDIDKSISNNITLKIKNKLNKKNINIEVFIYKINKKLIDLNIDIRVKAIVNDILNNLKKDSCNNIYSIHKDIKASVFWVGEESNASNSYIFNNMSAWDEEWEKHFNQGLENKYYFALPYNDFDENGNRKENVNKIPWFKIKKLESDISIVKNRWIKINSNGKIAYAQWEDVGPINEDDFNYVFGNENHKNIFGLKAGIDLSPDLAKFLGLNGEGVVDWTFVPDYCVPKGEWTKVITKSNINWK